MQFKVYKLQFTSPLHIGNQRDDAGSSLRTIHSDTLQAALTACLAKYGKALPVGGDFGCAVSSLFPYYQHDVASAPVYFLPMPLQARLPQLKDPADAKKVKKVQWVDAELYSRLLAGEQFFDGGEESQRLIHLSYLTANDLPGGRDNPKDFIRSEVMQRVRLQDRTGRDDAFPYYVDRIFFAGLSGLYFLAYGDTTLLETALQFLQLEGLGTDRNVGYGNFKIIATTSNGQPLTLTLNPPVDAAHVVSLSLFIPESQEQLLQLMDSPLVAYDFVRRGGWITTPPHTTFRKNAVYGFTPGSVFRGVGSVTPGAIVNLKPELPFGESGQEHPIWRCGRSIMLPIILK